MPIQPAPAAHYRDAAGVVHEILVRPTAEGAWEIVDTTRTDTRLVDTLSGFDDGRPQADAVARDYASQQQRRSEADELGFAA
jgi:hypothetical protein